MTRVGIVGVALFALTAGCGLSDYGTFALEPDGGGAGSLSSPPSADASPPAAATGVVDAGELADVAPPPLVDAGFDVDASLGAGGTDAALPPTDVDAAPSPPVCVAPPLAWTWMCGADPIGEGNLCVQGIGAVPMPYDCRQCTSSYDCACVLAHFGEQNACGTRFVDGGNETIAPVSCTDLPDAGQFVVCPTDG
jgi:hypothetical protein